MNIVLNEAKSDIVNTIKLLLYKKYPKIIDSLDFENESIYVEPLLFSYFNDIKHMEAYNNLLSKQALEEILQVYFIQKKELKIKHSFNRNGIV